jgi:hypothetical protein
MSVVGGKADILSPYAELRGSRTVNDPTPPT